MKRLSKTVGQIIVIVILFLVGAMLYSTIKGYTTWYFRVNGQVTVDGRHTTGYLHANLQRTLLLPEIQFANLYFPFNRRLVFDFRPAC